MCADDVVGSSAANRFQANAFHGKFEKGACIADYFQNFRILAFEICSFLRVVIELL